jgi:hypothetical protein
MLLLLSAQCFKKESSSFKGKRKKKCFLQFGVPKCIPYDSFMFPTSAQWFFYVPYVPNSSTLLSYMFWASSSSCKPYR